MIGGFSANSTQEPTQNRVDYGEVLNLSVQIRVAERDQYQRSLQRWPEEPQRRRGQTGGGQVDEEAVGGRGGQFEGHSAVSGGTFGVI